MLGTPTRDSQSDDADDVFDCLFLSACRSLQLKGYGILLDLGYRRTEHTNQVESWLNSSAASSGSGFSFTVALMQESTV